MHARRNAAENMGGTHRTYLNPTVSQCWRFCDVSFAAFGFHVTSNQYNLVTILLNQTRSWTQHDCMDQKQLVLIQNLEWKKRTRIRSHLHDLFQVLLEMTCPCKVQCMQKSTKDAFLPMSSHIVFLCITCPSYSFYCKYLIIWLSV